MEDGGRPSDVYCQYRVASPYHEVKLTEELIMWPVEVWSWLRGTNTDSQFRPDAELDYLALEYDTGEEGRRQVQKQCKKHQTNPKTVVWIFEKEFEQRAKWVREASNKNTFVKKAGEEWVQHHGGEQLHLVDFMAAAKQLRERRK